MKNIKKRKEVKAWVVCDSKNVPLSISGAFDGVMDRLIIVYTGEKAAKKTWGGFKVIPCTITYLTHTK